MGSKKSSASSTTSTTTHDNSAVAGNNAVALAAGANYSNLDWYQTSDSYSADLSDRSTRYTDASYTDASVRDYSDRSTYLDASVRDYSDRSVTATDSRDQSSSWYALDNSDRSVTATDDRSWYSYASDSRDLSTAVDFRDSRDQSSRVDIRDSSDRSVTNYTGTDPGVLKWNQQAAELLGAVAETNTDAVRYMTDAGSDVLRRMGESATSLYSTAGKNNAASWGDTLRASEAVLTAAADRAGAMWGETVDRSADLLGQITVRAGNTADAAGRLAEVAISSYQPPENAQANTARWGVIALAGVAALVVLPRILKA